MKPLIDIIGAGTILAENPFIPYRQGNRTMPSSYLNLYLKPDSEYIPINFAHLLDYNYYTNYYWDNNYRINGTSTFVEKVNQYLRVKSDGLVLNGLYKDSGLNHIVCNNTIMKLLFNLAVKEGCRYNFKTDVEETINKALDLFLDDPIYLKSKRLFKSNPIYSTNRNSFISEFASTVANRIVSFDIGNTNFVSLYGFIGNKVNHNLIVDDQIFNYHGALPQRKLQSRTKPLIALCIKREDIREYQKSLIFGGIDFDITKLVLYIQKGIEHSNIYPTFEEKILPSIEKHKVPIVTTDISELLFEVTDSYEIDMYEKLINETDPKILQDIKERTLKFVTGDSLQIAQTIYPETIVY